MSVAQVVEADLTWTGSRLERGVRVAIGADGRIARAGSLALEPTRRLDRQALLPGLVNAHSHAFQRGLRGHAERFPAGAGTFWSWRERMYDLAAGLDAGAFQALCVRAFREMLDAGITTVGEFHYLHHAADRPDYGFDHLVLEAAAEAGIRLVLLNAYYRTGAIGRPLAGPQLRFDGLSLGAYWTQLDRLAARLDPSTQHVGAAAHSLRAVHPDEVTELAREAHRRGLVLHVHVEEQRGEIEECVAAYGRRPMELLEQRLDDLSRVTAVHCTHTTPAGLERLLGHGGSVCVCPLTEANLGDGLPDLGVPGATERLSLGTDSNARISMLEEMRWLEYGQRLRREARGAVTGEEGWVAKALFDAATVQGARALGLDTGRIAVGAWADLVAIDLGAPALAGADADTLIDTLVFGAGDEVVAATCVAGRWRIRGEGA